jgi:hypothetical protein
MIVSDSYISTNFYNLVKLYLEDNEIAVTILDISCSFDNFTFVSWPYEISEPTLEQLMAIDQQRIVELNLKTQYTRTKTKAPHYSSTEISLLTSSNLAETGDLIINSCTGKIQVYVGATNSTAGSWYDNSDFAANTGSITVSTIGSLVINRLHVDASDVPTLSFATDATGSILGTDFAGSLSLVTSNTLTGTLITSTFKDQYQSNPFIQLTSANSLATLSQVFVEASTSAFTLISASVLEAGSYNWNYLVVGS